MTRPRVDDGSPPEESRVPPAPTQGLDEDPHVDLPITDPAHRTARWFMMLAPVLLVIFVFLLLRLSTG